MPNTASLDTTATALAAPVCTTDSVITVLAMLSPAEHIPDLATSAIYSNANRAFLWLTVSITLLFVKIVARDPLGW